MITSTLKVILWDKEIGRLSWDGRRGCSYFEYSREFLAGPLDAFPLVASIKNPMSARPIMGDKETRIFKKLPPFIADSLPDAWGNQVFECWRVENGLRNQEITPLDVLSFIGRRGMGALEFIPETSGIKQSEKINLTTLTELAQRIFTERENVRIRPEETITMRDLIAVGTSAGGRQPKAILAINPKTGEIRSGQIAGQEGFEYCILKFGDPERSSAELEMAYYRMATAAGIQMMPCRLMEIDGRRHFVTRRFDRSQGRKLHIQTLAALYPEADSYEKLLMACRKMRLPESASEEVFRRMVFNILANNTDDHNKNFSFLMNEQGRWSLSPAYDISYIFNTGGYQPETAHCIMTRGKVSGITIEDVRNLAKENGIRKAETIIKEVADAVARFRQFAEESGVQEKWIGLVERCLTSHLEDWELAKRQNISFEMNGHRIEDAKIEQAYRGNLHLLAKIDGRQMKRVIRSKTSEYSEIVKTGVTNITEDELKNMIGKYFLGDD